jgi:O-antigen/teichoic acid export membrane protein
MKKNYIFTFITEFTVLLSGLFIYRLVFNILGKEGFSEYALIKRTVSFIYPALVLGLGVGIPRFIAFNYKEIKKANTYFISGFIISFFVVLIFFLIINFFSEYFSFLFFGDRKYYRYVLPLSVLLIGLILHMLCYSYFRGNLLMRKANLLQLLNLGIIPIFVFIIWKNLWSIIFFNGVFVIIISFFFLVYILKDIEIVRKQIFKNIKDLLYYSVQRIPADFGLSALLSLPATISAHISGITVAGYVAFGISLLNMIGAVFEPLGLILLPKTTQLVVNKDFESLKYYISKILKVTCIITVLVVFFFEIIANEIITLYLGNPPSDLVIITRIIVIASLGYTTYISMRSVIDAYYVKAINTKNILFSLLFFLCLNSIVRMLNKNYIFLVVTFVISISLLGILTLIEISKLFRKYDFKIY